MNNVSQMVAFQTFCELRSHKDMQMSTQILRWLKFSSLNTTYELLLDDFDRPIGYVAWAKINRESLFRVLEYGLFPQFEHEWKEGHITLILDICHLGRWSQSATNQIIRTIRKHKILCYQRNGYYSLWINGKRKIKKRPLIEPLNKQHTTRRDDPMIGSTHFSSLLNNNLRVDGKRRILRCESP